MPLGTTQKLVGARSVLAFPVHVASPCHLVSSLLFYVVLTPRWLWLRLPLWLWLWRRCVGRVVFMRSMCVGLMLGVVSFRLMKMNYKYLLGYSNYYRQPPTPPP